MTGAPAPPKTDSARRRLLAGVEVALLVIIAFFVGRLTISHVPKPGPVDIGFSQDMAVHHEQAVLMANLAEQRGGVAVAALANAILVNQSQEIGLMRGWLQLWHRPADDPSPMSWMRMTVPDTSMPGMSMPPITVSSLPAGSTAMPGMASPAQLTELDGLSGKAFDVLFLQLMIRHHEGGIEMAQYARAHASLATVRNAAQAMAYQQIEDIGEMRSMLTAEGGKELPAP